MITIPLRILLVEDNEADVLITKRSIEKLVESPVIEVAEDISSCRHHLVNFVPDLIISDYNLPTCTGMDVLELVKEKDPSMPLIFLTGTVQDEEVAANTILAGASGYILKKDMKSLEEKLKPLLNKVVFNMVAGDELRERLRRNKIAINQIYDYLDSLKADNKEQRENILKIKETIRDYNIEKDGDDSKA